MLPSVRSSSVSSVFGISAAAPVEKVTDVFQTFAGEALSGEGVVLKKGKKNFRKVLVK